MVNGKKLVKILCFLIGITSYNSIGQTGLIHLPSGSLQDSGTVGLTIGRGSLNELISIIATPFPWLEASFFYHRPRDTFYIKKNVFLFLRLILILNVFDKMKIIRKKANKITICFITKIVGFNI